MSHIQSDPDPNKRYHAYAALGKRNVFETPEQKMQAVDLLIAKLEESKEPLAIRAVICRTLGEIRDPKARGILIKTIGHPEGILRAEACRALGKIGQADDASLLARVMTIDNLEDCRMAAIEGLGEMKANDPRVIQILIDGMEHDDPAIRMASLTALRKISGKDLGIEIDPWRKHFEPLMAQAAAPPVTNEVAAPKSVAPGQGGQPSKTTDPGVIKSTRP
ncbi:MAG: hypothetical protein ABS79_05095 [Planctomycetes bacterium SCN 63-9]|nr:MAG: hypothetical protein ABS79_05095 [Planctomycetes bacterium SCN 63-9]